MRSTFFATSISSSFGALLFSVVCVGCGDNSGSDSSDSGDDSDSSDTGNTPTGGFEPDLLGEECGPGLPGWATRCYQSGSYIRWSWDINFDNPIVITDVVAPDHSEFSPTCCEGSAGVVAADNACIAHCRVLVCNKAQSNHLDIAEGLAGVCADPDTCGFDMDACLTGSSYQQTIGFVLNSYIYYMEAWCGPEVESNEPFNEGIFDWHEVPVNNLENDPPFCNVPVETGKDPSSVVSDDVAVEDAGTTAAVRWTILGVSDVESSQDVAVKFAYDLYDCPTHARCLNLADLRLELPLTTVQGVVIQNARLSVYQIDVRPVQQSSGAFSFGPGTVHAILSATAAGVPIMLQGVNVGTATGLLAPASDSLTLSGLAFDYSDSVIDAQLQIDIVGDYIERGPTAVIVPVNVPGTCTDPVTFRAASSDPDLQSLTNFWWVPGTLVDSGPTLDITLANGTHPIVLFSQDSDGRLDAAGLLYTRTCR